jgi:hypothetical protein
LEKRRMELFDTPLEPLHLQRNSGDFAEVRRIAGSGDDHPVQMLNMNRYTRDSGFPAMALITSTLLALDCF